MGRVVGIDLGTSNSCVALMQGGVPEVIPNEEGTHTTPSVVAFTAGGDILVGGVAKRQALTNPRRTVTAVKRLLGLQADSPEARRAQRGLPYDLIAGRSGDLHIRIDDRVYSPPEIASLIFHKLRTAAEEYLGDSVDEAVVAAPPYFGDAESQATRDAGRLAGLELSFVLEATAAALVYRRSVPVRAGTLLAVYDLGGGRFDCTILEAEEAGFRVRGAAGRAWLGGENLDQRVIDWLIEEFWNESRVDLRCEPPALQRLKEATERARCALSTSPQVEVDLPGISTHPAAPPVLHRVLTRERFESLTDDLVELTVEPCEKSLETAGLRPAAIDEVLLVGGPTRAPGVATLVRRVFGRVPYGGVSANEGVARGAALQAAAQEGPPA